MKKPDHFTASQQDPLVAATRGATGAPLLSWRDPRSPPLNGELENAVPTGRAWAEIFLGSFQSGLTP